MNTLLDHVPIKLEAPENGDGGEAAVEEEDGGDDEEDETDSETDELLEEDVALQISSEEEAELEAQRIRFPEILGKGLLNNVRRASSVSSSGSSVVVLEKQKKNTAQQQQQQTTVEHSVRKRRQKRASSTCSVASSLVTPSSQTESCGNIFVYQEQQKLIFNCSFCDLRYSDINIFSKHLNDAHKLFQDEAADVGAAQPQRKSARQQAKQIDAQQSPVVEVKQEMPQADEQVKIAVTMESCGNIFVLNRKKLFLICGYCECKYANLELFDKHLRQQHELFTGPSQEINVLPKEQVKTEVFIITELPEAAATSAATASTTTIMPTHAHISDSESVKSVRSINSAGSPKPMVAIPTEGIIMPVDVATVEDAADVSVAQPSPSPPLESTPQVVAVATTLPALTPETPPPEEDEKEDEKLILETAAEREEKSPGITEQENVKEKLDNGVANVMVIEETARKEAALTIKTTIENIKQVAASATAATTTKRKQKRKRRTHFTRRRTVTKQKKVPVSEGTNSPSPTTLAITATTREPEIETDTKPDTEQEPKPIVKKRSRRTSSAQKSYKDFFIDQLPPSSPESAASAPTKSSLHLTLPSLAATEVEDVGCLADTESVCMPLAPALLSDSGSPNEFPTTSTQLRFPCDHCSKSFRKSSRLSEHVRLHTGEKPFHCGECGKKFRIKMRLTEHQMRHRKEKAFKCLTCGLAVSTKQDLVLHQRHHTGDRRYQCTDCPKAFVRSSDLKIHIRVHTGEKPFACEICNKSFRANQNLIVHRRSHLGEKNYKCEYCDKRFMRNIDRKVHHRTHTGEKPFKCEICQRCYSSRAHVRSHIEREHMANPNGIKRERKKPGPKPKRLHEELAKQKQLIAELQQKLLEQIKTDDNMEVSDVELNNDEIIDEGAAEKTTTSPPSINDNKKTNTKKQKQKQKPQSPTTLTIRQKIEHSSPPQAKVVGMQQVSVTVSMQVENVADASIPGKENDTRTTPRNSGGKDNLKRERKITSYFTVVGQKAEI